MFSSSEKMLELFELVEIFGCVDDFEIDTEEATFNLLKARLIPS